MATLKKDKYIISKETLEAVIDALAAYHFSEDGCYNNDDIIEAQSGLEFEISKQDELNG